MVVLGACGDCDTAWEREASATKDLVGPVHAHGVIGVVVLASAAGTTSLQVSGKTARDGFALAGVAQENGICLAPKRFRW